LGANSAVRASAGLNENDTSVTLLLSLDPTRDHTVTPNVSSAANFFQTGEFPGGGVLTAEDASRTSLENRNVTPMEHTAVDDRLVQMRVLDLLIRGAASRF
jgi:hypothetical protein